MIWSGNIRGNEEKTWTCPRADASTPKIIFLDEPTLGLDPQTRETIWGYIENLSRVEKVTIIITTHYMEEADRLCSRLAIIDTGKIVALDSPSNMKKTIGGDIVTLKITNPDMNRSINLISLKIQR